MFPTKDREDTHSQHEDASGRVICDDRSDGSAPLITASKIIFHMSLEQTRIEHARPSITELMHSTDTMKTYEAFCSEFSAHSSRKSSAPVDSHDSMLAQLFESHGSALEELANASEADWMHAYTLAAAGASLDTKQPCFSIEEQKVPLHKIERKHTYAEEDLEPPRTDKTSEAEWAASKSVKSASSSSVTSGRHQEDNLSLDDFIKRNGSTSARTFSVDATDFTELDVICQRGGLCNHHPGNQRYLSIKDRLQPAYLKACRREKTQISQDLVDAVHAYGGRFLRRQGENGAWYEVDNVTARTKAAQALREDLTAADRAEKRRRYPKKKNKNAP